MIDVDILTKPKSTPVGCTINVKGKPFRCTCGCNVFSRQEDVDGMYRCNACRAMFTSDGMVCSLPGKTWNDGVLVFAREAVRIQNWLSKLNMELNKLRSSSGNLGIEISMQRLDSADHSIGQAISAIHSCIRNLPKEQGVAVMHPSEQPVKCKNTGCNGIMNIASDGIGPKYLECSDCGATKYPHDGGIRLINGKYESSNNSEGI